MDFKIHTIFKKDKMQNNTYVLYDSDHNCIVIDVSYNKLELVNFLDKNNLKPLGFFVTHGHFDHLGQSEELAIQYKTKIYINKRDKVILDDGALAYVGKLKNITSNYEHFVFFAPEKEKKIKLNKFIINLIPAYGHTPGSTLYNINNYIFTGDVLFFDIVGIVPHIPFYNHSDNILTLKRLYNSLDNKLILMPGHYKFGDFLSIAKKENEEWKDAISS